MRPSLLPSDVCASVRALNRVWMGDEVAEGKRRGKGGVIAGGKGQIQRCKVGRSPARDCALWRVRMCA